MCVWSGRTFMTILLFHRVTDEIPEDGLTVSLCRFRQLCRMLRDDLETGDPWIVPIKGGVALTTTERAPEAATAAT